MLDSIITLTFASEATITGEKGVNKPNNDPSPTPTLSGSNVIEIQLGKTDISVTMISIENETEWFFKCPAQAILAVDQITQTLGCTNAFDYKGNGANQKALEEFLVKNKKNLQEYVTLV
ncbi:MAG: hypothetical protein EZS28_007048 [Streblomastix strix]|uniref:Uncharacterized protein n=1 Tax=Streblomastix strix TaxID=222440 RepID=A0A5J4WS74_9EUKA|nr:MAG: hypothetical protein EZS28_007048 [Streblomastix strix]